MTTKPQIKPSMTETAIFPSESDDIKTDESGKEDKEARKKRKELRRKKREEFQKRLEGIDNNVAEQRNPIIIEIVKEHLKKDIDVFQARWQTGSPLSNQVFLNTPLFWYKKHKWSHKDVKEFFKITGVYKENLDGECAVIWGIDETSKKKKKEKRKRLKEKHLRKESFASLLTLRHSSLRLMQERSMQFVQKDDPKAERASLKIWNLLVKNRGGSEEKCPELNHAQFNIGLVDNNISVDPDMSVDLFYELIRTWEIIEKHREDKKNNPQKYTNSKKNKYKQSRGGGGGAGLMSMKQIGGSSAYFMTPQLAINGDMDENDENDENKKSKEEEKDPPQKEKIKYIKKKFVNRQYIKRMLRHINKNIKREHQVANPKKLKKSKLLLVVFGKIFDAMQNGQEFDVQNDYISQALTSEQLNNPTELLEILETRDAEWKQRVQCLEYIESNISTNSNLFSLFEDEKFLLLIVGWTTQLYDERSRITQTAAELFPSLLTILLSRMDTPAMIFEQENECLSVILEGLFTLLKNKRAKTLADIAHDVLIETINILATVAADLDETAYHRIMNLLYDHTCFDKEKHEKVRAGCIAYSLFIIYGTESQEIHNNMLKENENQILLPPTGGPGPLNKSNSIASVDSDNPSPVASDNEENDEQKTLEIDKSEIDKSQTKIAYDKSAKEKNVKIAKKPQRAFLFDDEIFMGIFAKIIGNGIEDRGKETREKAMKVLKKIEATHSQILEKYIDGLHLNKFAKWKKFNTPKGKGKGKGKSKKKRISPIKRQKTVPPKKLLTKKSGGAKSVGANIENDANDANDANDKNLENHENHEKSTDDTLTVPNGDTNQ